MCMPSSVAVWTILNTQPVGYQGHVAGCRAAQQAMERAGMHYDGALTRYLGHSQAEGGFAARLRRPDSQVGQEKAGVELAQAEVGTWYCVLDLHEVSRLSNTESLQVMPELHRWTRRRYAGQSAWMP